MSSLFLFNPINIPNLLTPFRVHLEMQFVFYSLIFLSLLGYVIYTFFNMGWVWITVILLLSFLLLVFLFLVLRERDRLDEEILSEEFRKEALKEGLLEDKEIVLERDRKLLKHTKEDVENLERKLRVVGDENKDDIIAERKKELRGNRATKLNSINQNLRKVREKRAKNTRLLAEFDNDFSKEYKELLTAELDFKLEENQQRIDKLVYDKQLWVDKSRRGRSEATKIQEAEQKLKDLKQEKDQDKKQGRRFKKEKELRKAQMKYNEITRVREGENERRYLKRRRKNLVEERGKLLAAKKEGDTNRYDVERRHKKYLQDVKEKFGDADSINKLIELDGTQLQIENLISKRKKQKQGMDLLEINIEELTRDVNAAAADDANLPKMKKQLDKRIKALRETDGKIEEKNRGLQILSGLEKARRDAVYEGDAVKEQLFNVKSLRPDLREIENKKRTVFALPGKDEEEDLVTLFDSKIGRKNKGERFGESGDPNVRDQDAFTISPRELSEGASERWWWTRGSDVPGALSGVDDDGESAAASGVGSEISSGDDDGESAAASGVGSEISSGDDDGGSEISSGDDDGESAAASGVGSDDDGGSEVGSDDDDWIGYGFGDDDGIGHGFVTETDVVSGNDPYPVPVADEVEPVLAEDDLL